MSSKELEEFLNRHKLSITAFAELLGVTFMAVTHWLQGKRSISKTISRLCKLFDKHPELMKEFEG
jgi:plasmid maintenance system antidote protein VapI